MDGPFSRRTIARMVRCIDPGWRLREATPVESGFSAVYRLTVAGMGTCYLKAAVEEQGGGIPVDARLATLLGERTDLPVPRVLGVVDEHESLPAPFHLTEPVPGRELPYEAIGWADDRFCRRLARDVGVNLADLHSLDVVGRFGYVDRAGPSLNGGRPVGTPEELTVVRGNEAWPTYLRRRVESGLEEHAEGRFGDLTDRLGEWFDERIDALSGPFRPALGRNDHGLHNVLVEGDTGAVTGLPDWAYTLAVPPAYDVAFAVYIYGGAYLAGIPGVRDRRALVRDALLAGYRSVAPDRVEALEPKPVYGMAAALRLMNHFEGLRLPPGGKEAAAARLRSDVRAVLDGQS